MVSRESPKLLRYVCGVPRVNTGLAGTLTDPEPSLLSVTAKGVTTSMSDAEIAAIIQIVRRLGGHFCDESAFTSEWIVPLRGNLRATDQAVYESGFPLQLTHLTHVHVRSDSASGPL